jgi:hypothetical protein
MNTKFFFLLLVLLVNSSYSYSSNTKKELNGFETVILHNAEVVHFPGKKTDDTKAKPIDMESHNKTRGSRLHSEEDGKHHHFHFHRLNGRSKRKYVLLVIAKLVLVISHLSALLYMFMHSIH